MKHSFFLLIFFLPFVSSYAQGFTIDTVADPRLRTSSPGYSIGQPQYATEQVQESAEEEQLPGQENSFDRNRIIVGGSFGLLLGSYTAINISPQVGYAFNGKFSAGGGPVYNYYRYAYSDLSFQYIGLNIYARYQPIRYLQLQVQPEIYNRWGRQEGVPLGNTVVPVLLLGGGGTIPVTANSGISIMIYYDVVQSEWSPYNRQLFYTIGYNFFF